jgi:hypothetical protein
MNSGAQIYLYFNASTPMAPEVIAAMGLVLGGPFGNPSREHWAAGPARDSAEKARKAGSEAFGLQGQRGGLYQRRKRSKQPGFDGHFLSRPLRAPAHRHHASRAPGNPKSLPFSRKAWGPESLACLSMASAGSIRMMCVMPSNGRLSLSPLCMRIMKSVRFSRFPKSVASLASTANLSTRTRRRQSEKSRPGSTNLVWICCRWQGINFTARKASVRSIFRTGPASLNPSSTAPRANWRSHGSAWKPYKSFAICSGAA